MSPEASGTPAEFDHDEGWYTDPYGRHEARWMSLGKATALVRDGSVESQDPPPAAPATREPVRIPAEGPGTDDGHDLLRADDAEKEFIDPEDLQRRMVDAAEEGVDGAPMI